MGILVRKSVFLWLVVLPLAAAVGISLFFQEPFSSAFWLTMLVTASTIGLTTQGIFSLFWMLYAWEDPAYAKRHASPRTYSAPQHSFSAIIPARHEERVLADTMRAVANIHYPFDKTEILVVCRRDDQGTIAAAEAVRVTLGQSNIRLIVFDSQPINKPHALNIGLEAAQNDVVAVFDAEDEPHPDIYHIVNTVMVQEGADVVQSGVQLMNFLDRWYSALNVLEYFFWFKSGLHFFARVGHVTPLGGNTVFIKRAHLEAIGGWDERCLTEDAEIGLRLSLAGRRVKVVYDERHVTREETPLTTAEFVRQRTRWIQGFLQILFARQWQNFPRFRQQLFSFYILLSSSVQTALLCYVPVALWVTFTQKLPIAISLLSYVPLYLLALQLAVYGIGLYEFTRAYHLRLSWWMLGHLVVTFVPYQMLLGISALRAWYRFVWQEEGWEKTRHANAHRRSTLQPAVVYVAQTQEA